MSEKIIKKEKIIYWVSTAVLLAFFTQLFNFPNKAAFISAFIICVIYFGIQRKIPVGVRELVLLAALLVYIWFSGKRNLNGISIVLLPLSFQLAARYLIGAAGDNNVALKRLGILLGVFAAGYTIHAGLNAEEFLISRGDYPLRHWPDFWTGNVTPATQHNIYYLPILALIFPAMLYIKKYKALCTAILAAAVFSLWFSVISQSRTPLLILVIVLVGESILFIIFNWNNEKRRRILWICGAAVLVISVIFALIIWLNWEAVRTSSFYAVFSRDGGILHNIRFQAQLNALKQLWVYPFGGHQMELAGLNYAHNIWLDIANAAGIIPFALLVLYTLIGIYDLLMLIGNVNVCQEIKYAAAGLWSAMILYYMVEPALDASVQFIVPWTFMSGLICEYNRIVKAEVGINGNQ